MTATAAILPVLLAVTSGRAPMWVHLLPAGEVKPRDGRGPWRVDDMAAVIRRSQELSVGRSIAVDYDHGLDLDGAAKVRETPAAGWISRLEARADGLWGEVEWTPRAARMIADREYRYLSPVIAHSAGGEVLAVLRAALTNNPALGQLTALNAMGARMTPDQMMAQLRELLSLPAEADPSAIVEATRQLLTARNSIDPTKVVPIALFEKAVAEANRAQGGISVQAATMAVDAALQARQLLPFMRDWAIDLCTRDKEAFDGFLAKVAPGTTKMLHQLATPFDFSALAAEDRRRGLAVPDEIAGRLGLTGDDLKKYGSAQA